MGLGERVLTIPNHLSEGWERLKCLNIFGCIYLLYIWSLFSPFSSQGAHSLVILRVPHWPSELHFMELKRLKMEK